MRPILIVLALALAAAACGGDEAEQEPPRTMPPIAESDLTPPDTAAADTAVIDTVAGPADRVEGDGTESPSAAARGPRLYTVQVAAFLDRQSAQEWTRRLRSEGFPVWNYLAEVAGEPYYRVRVGALPTVAEAMQLGALITDRYEWPVWVAPLTPTDPAPENAVADSRRILEGG